MDTIDLGSVWRGIRAMDKPHPELWATKWDWRHWGRWFHAWTPIWHKGRGPYVTIGIGPLMIVRGY